MPDFLSISTNTQHNTERWTSRVLRLGVWVSASLMILGLFLASMYPPSILSLSTNPSLGNLAERLLSATFDPVTLDVHRTCTAHVHSCSSRHHRNHRLCTGTRLALCCRVFYRLVVVDRGNYLFNIFERLVSMSFTQATSPSSDKTRFSFMHRA